MSTILVRGDWIMNATEEMSPCRFCGESDLRVIHQSTGQESGATGQSNAHQVECHHCGARGPVYWNAGLAKLGWTKGESRPQVTRIGPGAASPRKLHA